MTARVWELTKNIVLSIEGEYQCDPDDKGNWTGGNIGIGKLKGTKYGISAASFPNVDIKNLTKEQAIILYKNKYWTKNKCDYMPDALSLAVFDYTFIAGAQGIRDLQRVLNVKIDGIVGNQTLGACNTQPLRLTIEKYFDKRKEYFLRLSSKERYKKYRKGWLNRIEQVKNICDKLI